MIADMWFGQPALWEPPPIPASDMQFFDLKGFTQQQLIDALNGSNICSRYGGCVKDPTNPSGIGWGLEGVAPNGPSYVCYSPRTTPTPVHVYVLLPRWSPPVASVRVTLIDKWNALSKQIYTHEAGHAAISNQDLGDIEGRAQQQSNCAGFAAVWSSPTVFDKMQADQVAYHARLQADCRPEIGCAPAGWLGW